MTPLMATLLGAILVPLFIASWRITLLGISCQGLLMAWIAYRKSADPATINGFLTLVDFAVLRGIVLPISLFATLRSQNAFSRNNLIPPNLLSWTLSLGIVLLGFNFSDLLVDGEGEARYVVAIVATGVMVGLQILATPSSGLFSQLIGALYIENAIAYFEQGHESGPDPIVVKLAQISVVVFTFLLYIRYLATVGKKTDMKFPEAWDGPTI